MKILVTGANSPLGSFFIRRLLETFNDCSILALSRTKLDVEDERLEELHFDLVLNDFIIDKKFDIIVHAAAIVPNKMKNVFELFQVNEEGSFNLFKRIKFGNNALVLNISTSSVYDHPEADNLFEYSQKTTTNQYGMTKLNFENMLTNFFKNSSVSLLSIRLPVVLVKDVKNNFMSKWLELIKNGKPIELSHPNALFNACIHSEDIFQFFLEFMGQSKTKNLTCNLSSKKPIKVIEVAKLMMESLNTSVPIIEREASKPAQLISHTLAHENGFLPRSVEDSIRLFTSE
jgi:nucleoside-diphosphate-sugar epimerase